MKFIPSVLKFRLKLLSNIDWSEDLSGIAEYGDVVLDRPNCDIGEVTLGILERFIDANWKGYVGDSVSLSSPDFKSSEFLHSRVVLG